MRILGVEGMTMRDLEFELHRGGRFVLYKYCVSVVVMTFQRPTDIYFVRAGESAVSKGLPWVGLSLVAGWWGFPWGPIFTIVAVATNLGGGKDVTAEVAQSLRASAPREPVLEAELVPATEAEVIEK